MSDFLAYGRKAGHIWDSKVSNYVGLRRGSSNSQRKEINV